MKKTFRCIKVTKVRVCVAMLVAVFGFGACGSKVDDAGNASSEPSMPTEADAPTSESIETVDPSESEGMESSDEVKSDEVMEEPAETDEPVVEKTMITAEAAVPYVNDLMENYKDMLGKEYIPAAYLVANYDCFDKEELAKYMESYNLSYDNIEEQFNNYVENVYKSYESTWMYRDGWTLTNEYPFANVVKFDELVTNKEDYEKVTEIYESFALRANAQVSDIGEILLELSNSDSDTISQGIKTIANIACYCYCEGQVEVDYLFDIIPEQ